MKSTNNGVHFHEWTGAGYRLVNGEKFLLQVCKDDDCNETRELHTKWRSAD